MSYSLTEISKHRNKVVNILLILSDAYIEKAPADLKTLLQDACQRYVVFDNIDKGGCAKGLLDLVDKMARHGASRFYSTAVCIQITKTYC